MKCVFTNDNNVEIKLPQNSHYSNAFKVRNNHEALFRRINTSLIQNKIIDPSKNIIDLGAWIGDNSVPWAMNIAKSGGMVYAIDPSKENCDFISTLGILNDLDNLCIISGVIGDGITRELHTSDDLFHCSFMSGKNYATDGFHKFQSCSLDEMFQSGSICNVGYIHLDVEGMEHLVLNGASTLIDTYLPVITFEQHILTDDYMSICRQLSSKNYINYMIKETLPGCRPDCRNFLSLQPSQALMIPSDVKSNLSRIELLRN